MQANTPSPNNVTFSLSSWATEIVAAIFSTIDLHPLDFFLLTGSTLHAILTNTTPQSLDIDMVTTASDRLLKNQGFIQNDHNPHLYTKSIAINNSNYYLEVFKVISHKRSLEEFIQEDQKRRDFTICKLYAHYDKQHKHIYIIDPTRQGIFHLHEKILHISGDPLQILNEDPMRLLRSIKYIMREYRPSLELYEALQAWERPKTLNGEILLRMHKKIKQLFKTDSGALKALFEKYLFLNKLFKLNDRYISVISNEEYAETPIHTGAIDQVNHDFTTITTREERTRSASTTSSSKSVSNKALKKKKRKNQKKKQEDKTKASLTNKPPIKIQEPKKTTAVDEKLPNPTPDPEALVSSINAFIALHSKKCDAEKFQPEIFICCKIYEEKQLYRIMQSNNYLLSYLCMIIGFLGFICGARQVIQKNYTISTLALSFSSLFFLKKGAEGMVTAVLYKHGFFENKSTQQSNKLNAPTIDAR